MYYHTHVDRGYKELHLCQYHIHVMQELKEMDKAKHVNVSGFMCSFRKVEWKYYSDEVWFHLSSYVNSHNSRMFSSVSQELPLHEKNWGRCSFINV